MLQKVDFEEDFQPLQEDRSHLLRPAFYWQVFKRRWAWFVLPVVLISGAGIAAALLWPPVYLSEGKILVQSQQIPSELVKSTVTNAAQERIQVIQQRTMTRDNLIAIADKFKLFPDKRTLMSQTELVAAVKKNTKFAPVDLQLDFKQRTRDNPTIIFSVGFEYSEPAVATQVANELMTRILNEDLRDRTTRATDTTRFLLKEVEKWQAELNGMDNRIAQLRLVQGKSGSSSASDQPTTLNQLKVDLIQKSAMYTDRHPIIQSIKKQIQALEAVATPPAAPTNDPAAAASLEALVAQQETLQKNLDTASAKLAAARLGENLERNQQSEKLEIIEQPTVPQEPIKPNRLKVMMLAVAAAFGTGAGLVLLLEFVDKGIRRSHDLLSVVGGQLIVSIPYITTAAELRARKLRIIFAVSAAVLIAAGILVAAYFFLPPLDLIIAKARVGLFR